MSWVKRLAAADSAVAVLALGLMVVVPLVEVAARPFRGTGIDNAAMLVQHLGLVLAMAGALVAERGGHLTSFGHGFLGALAPASAARVERFADAVTAIVAAMLAQASWRFVATEIGAVKDLAYGVPVWAIQAAMPLGFILLSWRIGSRCASSPVVGGLLGGVLSATGLWLAWAFDGNAMPLWPMLAVLLAALFAGAPIFAILGGLALALFWQDGQPLASVPLSHYQITVNPSLPALPLFTLAGLLFAHSGAARRLGDVFTAAFGSGATGSAIAAACLCSFFTAFTGGSGVTILALGGLLLPLLLRAGLPERQSIGLVTSASALGVLLVPSVPLIMYAIIARVPINDMFLAGLLPAVVMVVALLAFGGFLRRTTGGDWIEPLAKPDLRRTLAALWVARWEISAPVVAIGALVSGLFTPTESAALTAAYALITQSLIHRELNFAALRDCMVEGAQTIGGVMLILGMALGLTNFLIDAAIPDVAVEWAQTALPSKWAFLVALNVFLLIAGAMMEIFAAIVVLVPLLLPVALSYDIHPIHFGIIFLANMEMAFLCPPAGMNIYFASAMFGKPFGEVARSVVRPVLAMFAGSLAISFAPELSTALPALFGSLR
jgi:tripartite ATP-independent transporter DctM subunit